MLSRRLAFVRRLTACLLALCFGLFTAEALLADVHDGDATHEELVRADGERDHAAMHMAHGDMPETVQVAHTHASGGDRGDHPGERPAGQSEHAQHSCHCTHAHGVGPQFSELLASASVEVHPAPIAFRDQAPPGHDVEPQLRPPIV